MSTQRSSNLFSISQPMPSNTQKIAKKFVGRWHIRATSEWDYDYLSLVERPELKISSRGQGAIRFGAFNAEVDAAEDEREPDAVVRFSFIGSDEGDEVCGRGCAIVENGLMRGRITFHQGMVSNFEAEKLTGSD